MLAQSCTEEHPPKKSKMRQMVGRHFDFSTFDRGLRPTDFKDTPGSALVPVR
jgi:hypothetical protein